MDLLLSPFKHAIETIEHTVSSAVDAFSGHEFTQSQLKPPIRTSNVEKDEMSRVKPIIPRIAYTSAIACQQSYEEPSKRQEYIDLHYKYYPEYSNDRIAVYLHLFLTNQAIIAIRGTRITDEEDLEADVDIILGKDDNSSLVSKTQTETDNILSKLKNRFDIEPDNITITGHSLGAVLAAYCSYRKGNAAYLFNVGITGSQRMAEDLPSILNHIPGFDFARNSSVFKNPLITSYIMIGDPISASSSLVFENTVILRPVPPPTSPLQSHSLEFLIQNTQPPTPLRTGKPDTPDYLDDTSYDADVSRFLSS